MVRTLRYGFQLRAVATFKTYSFEAQIPPDSNDSTYRANGLLEGEI
jgi:hypothetical protein